MKRVRAWVSILFIFVLVLSTVTPVAAAKDSGGGYQTGFQIWRGDFSAWTASDPVAETDPYPAGAYYEHNFYNGGSYYVKEMLGPVVESGFAFQEAIASWNVDTPAGTWEETLVRARIGSRWTKWYNLGVWASGTDTVERHSVSSQGDADGYVAIDTFVLAKGKIPADALQLKVRLFSEDGITYPNLRSISLAYSSELGKKFALQPGDPTYWDTLVDVPQCSQMVYPDGGNVWCSPTSTSMVLGYWGIDAGPCEPRVRAAVSGVYDWKFNGYGNWPFNTAYAAGRGLEGYVARYTSLAALEPWIAAGVPVVMSVAWEKNDLQNAPIPSTAGHLIVLVGFDAQGNAIVNDPAAAADTEVRRTYLREELETVWLGNSGGTVYLIFPQGYATPGF